MARPKCRRLRQLVCAVARDCDARVLRQLLRLLLALHAEHAQVAVFVKLLFADAALWTPAQLQHALEMLCQAPAEWDDELCDVVSSIARKFEAQPMCVECFKRIVGKLESSAQRSTFSLKGVGLLSRLVAGNRKHARLCKQRLGQLVEHIAAHSSVRTKSLQRLIQQL